MARPRARGCDRCHRPCSRASAAGRTFTNRTLKAEWAARDSYTSVVDPAGAIYVIGGGDDTGYTYLNDVWVSTDGGARRDSVMGGMVGGYSRGYSRGY
jgi:hypothetical protein